MANKQQPLYVLLHLLQTSVIHPFAHLLLNLVYGIPELLRDGMSPQRIHIEVVGFRGEDQKGDHRHIRLLTLQVMVQTRQGFNKNIRSFVGVLISASDKEVQSLLQIKVKMSIKMTPNEL